MSFSFFGKDTFFFEKLEKQAEISCQSAKFVQKMIINYSLSEKTIEEIKDFEHKSDCITEEIAEKLNQSFITPIDREDIYTLSVQLDDITDCITELVQAFSLYNITEIRKETLPICKNLISITEETKKLIRCLYNLKDRNSIDSCAKEIDRYENIADRLYCDAVALLFKEEQNPIEIIRWEKIFACLENTANQCKKTAKTVHTIVIKHL